MNRTFDLTDLTPAQQAARERALANVAAANAAKEAKLDEICQPYLDRAEARRQEEADARRQRQEQREAAQRAKEQAEHEQLTSMLRQRYLAGGGTSANWERDREAVVAGHLQQTVLAGDEPARVANQRRYG